MYCRKCYGELGEAAESKRCPKCNRRFDPANPRTYLVCPFPDVRKIIFQVIATTVIGFVAAYMVAFLQMIYMSGH